MISCYIIVYHIISYYIIDILLRLLAAAEADAGVLHLLKGTKGVPRKGSEHRST